MTDTDPRCQKCGHPRSNHPYRHMFVGPSKPDTVGTRADLATPMRCAECDCEKGGADCNWIATPAPAVKVKALVWTECNSGNFKQGHCFTARSMVDFAPIAVHKKADGWWLNKDCTTYPTIDAAKAAAQADYEATILAALEPATTMNDPLVEALMKKARAVVDRWDSPLWKDLPHTGESIDDLRAALSALEENK